MFASVKYAHVVSLGVTCSAFKSISVEEQEVKKKKNYQDLPLCQPISPEKQNPRISRNQTFRYKLILNCFDRTAYSC